MRRRPFRRRPLEAKLAPVFVVLLLLAASRFGIALSSTGTELSPAAAARLIGPDAVAQSVERLASAEMEGRNTPNRGLDRAAEFLAQELSAAGCRPLGDDGTFFHRYSLDCLVPGEDTSLSVEVPESKGAVETLALGRDFVPIRGSEEGSAEGEIAFVGYGIDARSEKYDDFGSKAIRGKVALCFWHEPRERSKGKAFDGPAPTKYSSFEEKAAAAKERGAVALLVVTDPLNHDDTEPIGYQFPFYASANPHERRGDSLGIPAAHVSLEVAEKLAGRKLAPVQKSLDSTLRGKPFIASGRRARLVVRFKTESVRTQNVVAYYPGGEGELAPEAIVISAHYDHIGRDSQGNTFYGADDDGSGTAAVLEIARAWCASGIVPPRGLVFAFFSGEEKGLLGSKAYVERPPYPIDRTVANLNMDMIGRNDRGRINAVGKRQNESLWDIAARAGRDSSVGIKVEDEGNEFFNRSDHYNFFKSGVPFLFFFSGIHEDYHRITDTPDKIDPKKLSQVARLVFLTSLELARSDVRPKIKSD